MHGNKFRNFTNYSVNNYDKLKINVNLSTQWREQFFQFVFQTNNKFILVANMFIKFSLNLDKFRKQLQIFEIINFQKSLSWKFFVEFLNEKDANNAISQMNDFVLFADGSKINSYKSQMKQLISFQNQKDILGKSYQSDLSTSNTQIPTNPSLNQNEFEVKLGLSDSLDQLSLAQSLNMENFLDTHESLQKIDQNEELGSFNQKFLKYAHVDKCFENNKSPTIQITELKSDLINIQILFNLFSNFGNIHKILFIKSKNYAFIEYQNSIYSQLAKEYLNNMNFLGQSIRIFYSKYQQISIKFNNLDNFAQYSKKDYRFKSNILKSGQKSISINPPSSVLHVSNLKPEFCNQFFFKHIFNSFELEKQKIINKPQDNKYMALLKFKDLETSVKALCYFHNMDIGGRNLQISFTKSKI